MARALTTLKISFFSNLKEVGKMHQCLMLGGLGPRANDEDGRNHR